MTMARSAPVTFALAVLVTVAAGAAATGDALPAAQNAVDVAELWREPVDLEDRDLFNGPWGAALAPHPAWTYTFVKHKTGGINPGMTVRDPHGREWKVKQPPLTGRGAEGPIETVLSRVLSAVGYHQPPVYFLPTFTLQEGANSRVVPGGRFRLDHSALRDRGEWAWLENPFIGTRPYKGLLVILVMFNSSDLKNSNNTLYHYTPPAGDRVERWFVVRDLGTALGSTGRVAPIRGNPDVFERRGFIKRIDRGFVEFHYDGRHQSVLDHRLTPADVHWASALLARLSERQWRDAFRAGGYGPETAGRFIAKLQSKIRDGLALGAHTTDATAR
jgi:hypothetical protein